jgi:hypothetical protein
MASRLSSAPARIAMITFTRDKDEDILKHVLKKELCHKKWQK